MTTTTESVEDKTCFQLKLVHILTKQYPMNAIHKMLKS